MAMYKYNETWTLPGVPAAWDQTALPYGVIVKLTGTVTWRLLCLSEPFYIGEVDGVQVIAFPPATNHSFYYMEGDEDWWSGGSDDEFAAGEDFGYFKPDETQWVWCNENICDDAGNVVYAKSVPVLIEEEEPEPEPEEFDSESFKIGLALGLCSEGR